MITIKIYLSILPVFFLVGIESAIIYRFNEEVYIFLIHLKKVNLFKYLNN